MDCIGKNSIPFFVVIEKISTIFSGSFETKEWKECISQKKIFEPKIFPSLVNGLHIP